MSVASGKEELSDRLLLLSDVGLRFSKFVRFVKILPVEKISQFRWIGILSYKEISHGFETNLKYIHALV